MDQRIETIMSQVSSVSEPLHRLNQWFTLAGVCSVEGNWFYWKKILDNVYKELYPKVAKSEDDFKKMEAIQQQVNREEYRYSIEYHRKQAQYRHKIRTTLPYLLDHWEKQLRTIAEKYGLLLPDKQDNGGEFTHGY